MRARVKIVSVQVIPLVKQSVLMHQLHDNLGHQCELCAIHGRTSSKFEHGVITDAVAFPY